MNVFADGSPLYPYYIREEVVALKRKILKILILTIIFLMVFHIKAN